MRVEGPLPERPSSWEFPRSPATASRSRRLCRPGSEPALTATPLVQGLQGFVTGFQVVGLQGSGFRSFVRARRVSGLDLRRRFSLSGPWRQHVGR